MGITLTCLSLPMLYNGIWEVFFPCIFFFNSAVKKISNSEDETLHLWTQCLCWHNSQRRICGETQGSMSSQIHPPFIPTKTTQANDGSVEIPAVTHGQPVQLCLAICEAFRRTEAHCITCALRVGFPLFLGPVIAGLLLLWAVGQDLRETLWYAKEKA